MFYSASDETSEAVFLRRKNTDFPIFGYRFTERLRGIFPFLQIPTILPNYSNFYRACQGIFARDNLQSFYLFLFILTKNSLFFRSKRAKLGILTVTLAQTRLAQTRLTACALLELALLKLALLKLTLPHVPCSHSSYRMRLARTHLSARAVSKDKSPQFR